MRYRLWFITVLCVCLLLTFCGCNKPTSENNNEQTTTTDPVTTTTAAIVEIKLEDMLTAQEISDAVGVKMGKPIISGQGTTLLSIGEETKTVLNVELSEKPIDIFYMMLKHYSDLQACPNLGETAWFSPVYNQLLVYGNGYMITVELTGIEDADQIEQRVRCRQIAALLLEHL